MSVNQKPSFLGLDSTADTDNLDVAILKSPELQMHQFLSVDPTLPPIAESESEHASIHEDESLPLEINQPYEMRQQGKRMESLHTQGQEEGDPTFPENTNTSEIQPIGNPGTSNSRAWNNSSNGILHDQLQGDDPEYTSESEVNDVDRFEETEDSNKVESHEFFSPSEYNYRVYGEKAYLDHKLDRKFKETGKFCPQRANVNQILLYKDSTMLLHTFMEEPQNRKLHEGTESDYFYCPEHSQKRFIEGYNVVKFGYGKCTLTKCKIKINRAKKSLIIQGDTRNVFKISDMLGILIGQKTGTFLQTFKITKEAHFFYPWQCMSIVMRDRTIDFGCKVQSHLIDIWVGLSELIVQQNGEPVPTMIPCTRANFNLTVIKLKIFEECRERELNINDLFLLGMYRAMPKMEGQSDCQDITEGMIAKIRKRIEVRFEAESKFYRVTKMIYEVGHLIYRQKPNQSIKEKVNMRNEIRRMILFGLMTERLKKQTDIKSRLRKMNLSSANAKNLVALQAVVHIENQKILNSMRVSQYDAQNRKIRNRPTDEAHMAMLTKYRSQPLQRFLDVIDEAVGRHQMKQEDRMRLMAQDQNSISQNGNSPQNPREQEGSNPLKPFRNMQSEVKIIRPESRDLETEGPEEQQIKGGAMNETTLAQLSTAREINMESSTENPESVNAELRSGNNLNLQRLAQPILLDDSVMEDDD